MKLETLSTANIFPFSVRIAATTFQTMEAEKGAEAEYELQHNQGSQRTRLHDGILRHLNQRQLEGSLDHLSIRLKQPSFFGQIVNFPRA